MSKKRAYKLSAIKKGLDIKRIVDKNGNGTEYCKCCGGVVRI